MGKGVAQSDTLAWQCFDKAIAAGFAFAQFTCGQMYLAGIGRDDEKEGLRLLKLASQQGFDRADYMIQKYYAENPLASRP